MKTWKKTLLLIGFAITVVLFLFAALEERVIDGGPIHYTWLGMAFMFFAVAVAVVARGRKSDGGAGPPNA
jgi:hypothetical protein